jgi:hypothetical protein
MLMLIAVYEGAVLSAVITKHSVLSRKNRKERSILYATAAKGGKKGIAPLTH